MRSSRGSRRRSRRRRAPSRAARRRCSRGARRESSPSARRAFQRLSPVRTRPSMHVLTTAPSLPHRCAARLPAVVERLLGSPVLVALVKALVEEGVSHEAISNAPRIVEIAPGAADAAAEEEEEQGESAAAAAEEMVRIDPRARSDSEIAISEMAISEMAISEMAISEGFGQPGMDL